MEKEIDKSKDVKSENNIPQKKMRQIIIETDGDNINIQKAEVSGSIELIGVLSKVIEFINKK